MKTEKLGRNNSIKIITPISLLFLTCSVLGALIFVEAQSRRMAYKRDVNLLLTIATNLGYSTERKLFFDRGFNSLGADSMRLTFTTAFASEDANQKIKDASWNVTNYSFDDISLARGYFDHISGLEKLTYNGGHTPSDIFKFGTPILTHWSLFDQTTRNIILVYHIQPREPNDVLALDEKQIHENVVTIYLERTHRATTLFFQGVEEYGQNP